MINVVTLRGNLTADPTYKQVGQNNSDLCKFRVASSQVVGETVYIDVDTWGKTAINCNKFLHKGREVVVSGKLAQDTYKTKEGNNATKYYIVADIVDFIGKGAQEQGSQSTSNQATEVTEEVPF